MSESPVVASAVGTAVCAHCAAGGKPPLVKGPVVTPGGSSVVDFASGDFDGVLGQINLHRALGGRPAILHNCPVQGHSVYLYSDLEGVPA